MLKKILKFISFFLRRIGFNPRIIWSYKYFPKFIKNKRQWLKQGGKITKNLMILNDYYENAGKAKGHYFHQDLLVAKLIYEHKPKRHLDIGSRVRGFVAHVASFRSIEVIDIRPLGRSVHENIKFRQGNLMQPQDIEETDSISCLHAVEHFGLGRYNDPIDTEGHNKAITNLISLISPNGRLYISFPIGKSDQIHFNAHRVFHPLTIFNHPSIEKYMKLVRFDYVDDDGDLHTNSDVNNIESEINFGCGIYTFKKINNIE